MENNGDNKDVVKNESKCCCNCLPFVIWGALSLFFFYQYIARSSFITVLTNEYMQYFDIDAAGIGFLGSCYYFVYTCMQIPAGMIADKYSNRLIATGAALICSLGLFTLVATHHSEVAALGQVLIGLGSSFAFILLLKSITNWFPSNKVAIMTAYSGSIGCLGPVLGGPAVAYITKSFDWLKVIECYCVFGVIIAAFIWFVVRDKEQSCDIDHREEHVSPLKSLKLITSSKQAWILGLFALAQYGPLSALGDLWGVSFIKTAYGLNSEMSALVNNMLYLGFVIGGPVVAGIASKIDSYKKPMIAACITEFITLSLIIFCSNYINVVMLTILFFLCGAGAGVQLVFPLSYTLFPKSISGTTSGFINSVCMLSGVILMPLIGKIISICWNGTMVEGSAVYSIADYRYGLSSVLVFLVCGIILSFFIEDKSPNAH